MAVLMLGFDAEDKGKTVSDFVLGRIQWRALTHIMIGNQVLIRGHTPDMETQREKTSAGLGLLGRLPREGECYGSLIEI